MMIPAAHAIEVLRNKGVDSLHYASDVAGACRFLAAGALLTSGSEIFLDAVDIHAREQRVNKCGPVLLVFDAAILDTPAARQVWATRLAPNNWPLHAEAERWFCSSEELALDFTIGDHGHMLVIRGGDGALPFGRHLRKLIVDDPQKNGNRYAMAAVLLRTAMKTGGIDIPVEKRRCGACACRC